VLVDNSHEELIVESAVLFSQDLETMPIFVNVLHGSDFATTASSGIPCGDGHGCPIDDGRSSVGICRPENQGVGASVHNEIYGGVKGHRG
jgi:hypothetical protein